MDQLNYLTPAELIILQQHLKLGVNHLRQQLTDKEFNALLASSSVDAAQVHKIEHDEVEVSGNLFLVLNTILTATFGAWLGYSGFLGLGIASFWIFSSIVVFAALFGAFIGIQSVRFTKQQAKGAIHIQKLHLLQIQILKKVKKQRTVEMEKLIADLDALFIDLSRRTSLEKQTLFSELADKSKEDRSRWVTELEEILEERVASFNNHPIYKTYASKLAEIKLKLKNNLVKYFQDEEELGQIHSEFQAQKEKKIDGFLRKLINSSPKHSLEPPSWIQSNGRAIIIGLAPTLLGGFSSISVYLGGVPLILKNFGYANLFAFFTDPKVKIVECSISLLITLYFGFSFVYVNRKAFKRQRELVRTDKTIIQDESSLTVLDVNMLILKELKNCAAQLALSTLSAPSESSLI
jgi:hypothetical protein